jgi:hypothetical protein
LLTPAKWLNFTKKGPQSAIPQDALISQELGACGSLADCFNPLVSARTPQHRSFDSAPTARRGRQDFGSRLRRRENASTQILRLRSGFRLAAQTPRKRLNTDPSTPLRISARGSDAAKTPQLYKKQGSMRKSVNGLDSRAVRCLRVVYGLVQSVNLSPNLEPTASPAARCRLLPIRRPHAVESGMRSRRAVCPTERGTQLASGSICIAHVCSFASLTQ